MNDKAAKFQIIYDITSNSDNLLALDDLCKIAGVSKSGYCYWLNTAEFRMKKEE